MNNSKLKRDYIKYYLEVPIQKYASMAIGRDEDTIIRWKNMDKEFADGIKKAKAEWIRRKLIASKAEFALERLFNSAFKPTREIELSQTRTDSYEGVCWGRQ